MTYQNIILYLLVLILYHLVCITHGLSKYAISILWLLLFFFFSFTSILCFCSFCFTIQVKLLVIRANVSVYDYNFHALLLVSFQFCVKKFFSFWFLFFFYFNEKQFFHNNFSRDSFLLTQIWWAIKKDKGKNQSCLKRPRSNCKHFGKKQQNNKEKKKLHWIGLHPLDEYYSLNNNAVLKINISKLFAPCKFFYLLI